LTDNRLELAIRFIGEDRGIRGVKEALSREILSEFERAGIGIASATFEVVGFPPLRIQSAEIKAASELKTEHQNETGAFRT
jgi:hypothetical protein